MSKTPPKTKRTKVVPIVVPVTRARSTVTRKGVYDIPCYTTKAQVRGLIARLQQWVDSDTLTT